MIVFLNGRFVPEEQAMVPVSDRCFRYGDGLFEAVLAIQGRLFRWPAHYERLRAAAQELRFGFRWTEDDLGRTALELLAQNAMSCGVVRLALSRGAGPRGYAPDGSEDPAIIMTAHPAPKRSELRPWKLCLSPYPVAANDPLAHFKTCSRLVNVLAAMHARDAGADEALFVDSDGFLTEGASSNLFWIARGTVCSTPLAASVLPGITRRIIVELCRELAIPHDEQRIRPAGLFDADGVFVSLSSRGIVEAESLERKPLGRAPLVRRLQEAFEELLARECGERP